jgi:predicted nucleic acid-binding protein
VSSDVVVDTAPVVAYGDRSDPRFSAVEDILLSATGRLVVPAPVTAEIDYLLRERVGADPARGFLEDIADGRFEVVGLEAHEHRMVADLDRQYDDLGLGLADLSVVVLARRFGTRRILTFDERDFRAVRPLQGGAFTLLPADR